MAASTAPLRYGVDDRPPLRTAGPLGLEHVMVMMKQRHDPGDPGQRDQLLRRGHRVPRADGAARRRHRHPHPDRGLGPIGARLPIVQGTSFGFLVVSIPLAQGFGLSAVFGGALFVGVVQILFGSVFTKIRHLFPPLVAGVVVIGIGLIPTGIMRFAVARELRTSAHCATWVSPPSCSWPSS